MTKTKTAIKLPPRSKVKAVDTWDLAPLYKRDQDWEQSFVKFERQIAGYEKFKGKLGESSAALAACLKFDSAMNRQAERIGVYASLKCTEDQGNSTYQRMKGRFQHVATKASELSAFIRPEILAISEKRIREFLAARELKDWKLALERVLRYRPYTLSKKEEELLAMTGQMSEASAQVFGQLNNADLKWGSVKNEKGRSVELGHSTFQSLLHSAKPAVRKNAFHAFYKSYETHKNTIAAAYNGSVQKDCFHAKARGYKTARESALFADNVPLGVYDNLIDSVHKNLPTVHRYYELIDLLAYPRLRSRLTELGTSLKPLEAMAQGRIFVASDVGGHRELIRHGQTGFLCPAGDAAALEASIEDTLAHRAEWPVVRARARRFVEQERTWANSVARYAGVYERALQARGQPLPAAA